MKRIVFDIWRTWVWRDCLEGQAMGVDVRKIKQSSRAGDAWTGLLSRMGLRDGNHTITTDYLVANLRALRLGELLLWLPELLNCTWYERQSARTGDVGPRHWAVQADRPENVSLVGCAHGWSPSKVWLA